MDELLRAILDDNRATVEGLLTADSSLVAGRVSEARLYDQKIFHWLYVGDTALHLAAAGYRVEIVSLLLASGSDPNASMNMRHSRPLHYAADGYINGPDWDPERQVQTIERLLAAGADVNAPAAGGRESDSEEQTWIDRVSSRGAEHREGWIGIRQSTSSATRNYRRVSSVRSKSRDQRL
jgi:hypothetical protein